MPGPTRLDAVKAALIAHYSAPPAVILRRFRNGAILFAVGLTVIFLSNTYLVPSLTQELAVLAGLLTAALGFLLALMAEVRFIIGRLLHLIKHR